MRILVLGAGAVGGYFGARLAAAGVDVRFLVRPARAAALAERGLRVASPLGDLQLAVQAVTQVDAPADAVLLACKAYDLPAAIAAVAPAVGSNTLVLPLLNGLRHLDDLDAAFGASRVLGGLCEIGGTLEPSGDIRHLNRLQRLVLGARSADQQAPAAALHATLSRGGFAPELSPVVLQEMWEKFTFICTYAGMTTLMRAPIGRILEAQEGPALMQELLAECVATATAHGHAPRPQALEAMTASVLARGSRGTSSMLRDLTAGGRTEHDHLMGDMLRRARAAGVPAPLLRVSLAAMQAYAAGRG